jgi:hypothetical protein
MQGVAYALSAHGRGIREDRELGLGKIAVSEIFSPLDDLSQLGVKRGFAVAGKGDRIQFGSMSSQLSQMFLQRLGNLLRRREIFDLMSEFQRGVASPAVLAIETIKRAEFVVDGEKIDAERGAQSPRMHRSIDDSGLEGDARLRALSHSHLLSETNQTGITTVE